MSSISNSIPIEALFGIVGVGVGILLALFPARLVEARDTYKTLGSVLKLVGFELRYCDRIVKDRQQAVSDILNGLSQSQPVTLPLFNYFPTAAWTALWHLPNVLNDFPIKLHAFIAKLYGELDLGNQIVEHATLIAASLPTPTPQVRGQIQTMFKQHEYFLEGVLEHLQHAFPKIQEAENRAQCCYRILNATVWLLIVVGLSLFLYFLDMLVHALQNTHS